MNVGSPWELDFSRTIIMGVMNITPDSFFDGGQLQSLDQARLRADELVESGSDILDIGGESSRPGAEPVSAQEEYARVLPVVRALSQDNRWISVDTYHADTARESIAAGARMINDITALRGDAAMAEVLSGSDCAVVLMHMLGMPKTMQADPVYANVVDDIAAFFDERLNFAVRAGIKEERLWIDPGFGFGKTVEHNLALLRGLASFRRFGRPILIGTSNKSTIGAVLGLPVHERLEGTAATVAAGIIYGADAIRVHDVRAMARVARMTDAIVGKGGQHG